MSTPIIIPPPGYQWEQQQEAPQQAPSSNLPSGYQWEPQGSSGIDTSAVSVQQPPEPRGGGIPSPILNALDSRKEAIKNALDQRNVKDLLGNISAASTEGFLEPELEGTMGAAGSGGIVSAGKALAAGSLRPALGIGAGVGAYGLTNEALEKIGVPWWLRHSIAFPVGAAAGGAVAPETMEGVKSIGGLVKKLPSLFMNQAEEQQGASKVVAPPRITYRPEPVEVKPTVVKPPPVKMRDRSYLSGGEEESIVPKDARNMKTLDDIARAQANKPFKSLSEKDKNVVEQLYDKLRLGEKHE